MGFNDVTAAGQAFSEGTDIFGESFSYTGPSGGATTPGLVGVFNQVEIEYQFDEFSTKKLTGLICVTSKPQWSTASISPADRGVINYGSVAYQIEKIDGLSSPGEPAFTLTLKKLT